MRLAYTVKDKKLVIYDLDSFESNDAPVGELHRFDSGCEDIDIPDDFYVGETDKDKITYIELPRCIKSIGQDAFGGFDSVKTVYFHGDVCVWYNDISNAIGFRSKCMGRAYVIFEVTEDNLKNAYEITTEEYPYATQLREIAREIFKNYTGDVEDEIKSYMDKSRAFLMLCAINETHSTNLSRDDKALKKVLLRV